MGLNIFIVISLLLAVSHIESFSIRQKRGTDLTEALAILQRQRRRSGVDYSSPERALDRRPLTLDDVNELLRTSDIPEENTDRELDQHFESNGHFVDVQPPLEYDVPGNRNEALITVSVEPSRRELEDIFESDDIDGNASRPTLTYDTVPEKKTKEEMISVKGDGKIIQKKSIFQNVEDTVSTKEETDSDEDQPEEETLTKEEFHVLMKAVDKLQKQAVKFDEKVIETPEAKVTVVEAIENNGEPKEITIVQPTSRDELKSVLKGEEPPVVKEAEIIIEKSPDDGEERIFQNQVVSNVSPQDAKVLKQKEADLINVIATELENSMGEEAEAENEERQTEERVIKELSNAINENGQAASEWISRDDVGSLQKRTAKRAARHDPSANIKYLKDEIKRLERISELADQENDALTEALNEATLGQVGSVSMRELEQLEKAISIEEKLQALKDSSTKGYRQDNFYKRGEPWRRKRGRHVVDEESLPSLSRPQPSVGGERIRALDGQRQLDGQYLAGTGEADQTVASFFMSNADECPAIREYSTNCELADLYSLPVDFEARSLCNLHEMCYACGSSLHVGQDQCDLVYQTAASALCRGKQKCVLESEIFLRTMKLKQRYIPHTQSLCRSNCVMKFLGIL